jgi:hypothetical protein
LSHLFYPGRLTRVTSLRPHGERSHRVLSPSLQLRELLQFLASACGLGSRLAALLLRRPSQAVPSGNFWVPRVAGRERRHTEGVGVRAQIGSIAVDLELVLTSPVRCSPQFRLGCSRWGADASVSARSAAAQCGHTWPDHLSTPPPQPSMQDAPR